MHLPPNSMADLWWLPDWLLKIIMCLSLLFHLVFTFLLTSCFLALPPPSRLHRWPHKTLRWLSIHGTCYFFLSLMRDMLKCMCRWTPLQSEKMSMSTQKTNAISQFWKVTSLVPFYISSLSVRLIYSSYCIWSLSNISVGATMVGSIVVTSQEGKSYKK